MSDPFIGQIMPWAGNFAPYGWAFCNGQLLDISQFTALFAIIGTTYGGNGRTNFALPNMQGRIPIHAGQGPGLTRRFWGETGGQEYVELREQNLPPHTHSVQCNPTPGSQKEPVGRNLAALGVAGRGGVQYARIANSTMGGAAVSTTGGNQGHYNMPPFQVVNYCIALVGTFPSRN